MLTQPVNLNNLYSVTNKVFENMQAGLPAILSDVPEHRYLVSKYGIGLIVDNVSPTDVAQAIMKLRDDKNLYEEIRNNVSIAAQELCWEKEGMKLINKYKELLS